MISRHKLRWALEARYPLDLSFNLDKSIEAAAGREADYGGSDGCYRDLGWYCATKQQALNKRNRITEHTPQAFCNIRRNAPTPPEGE